ncbi:hypothetical protein [Actinoplanes awajinensis]|uniref:Uncharacterized protein n=1 Tax=Actinoplanes awajinensis subsp. mycoplanecinus TaxID=135947 RepID=A0A124GA64_9ACTN|nr:hypothetical protein [Actinoplanes awajinensis]KUL31267.1 hypothetical protein ADL15_22725 [Actinoplanes awajinensis subsp. mycoplanecinus]
MNYLEWNSSLLTYVIDRGDPTRDLYLYVDRDLLAKLSGLSPEQAVEDFSRAFQVGMGSKPFHRGMQTATKWRLSGFPGAPQFVIHLAMTVLAVTEDPIDGSVYKRQNALLGLPSLKSPPLGYDTDVPLLWRAWNMWLKGPGAIHGRPTARSHDLWSLQGWARSQALIRYHDRLLIEEYLAAGDPSFDSFRTWLALHRPHVWDRFREQPAMDILRAVFEEEEARFGVHEPRSRPATGPSQQQGLLSYDPMTGAFSGIVLIDEEWVGRTVDLGQGEKHTVDGYDPVLQIQPDVSELEMLTTGVQHRLADDLVMRFGGESLYALRDDARVDAQLQVRSVDHPAVVDLLVRADQVARVTSILQTAGLEPRQTPAGIGDWARFRDVSLTPAQPALLTGLGLGRAARAEQQCTFFGGLRVRTGLYLVGGEPDVHLTGDEPVTEVIVDGVPHPVLADDRRLALSDLALSPGQHRIESPCGTRTLRTEDYVHERPVHSEIARPIVLLPHGYAVKPTEVRTSAAATLAGAALDGVQVYDPVIIGKRPGTDTLMITYSGDVSEVFPTTPVWVSEAGMQPSTIDVLATVRDNSAPVACVLVRSRANERVQAIAVPSEAPRFEGKAPSRPRPDLMTSLVLSFRKWSWVGQRHPRVDKIMSTALRATERASSTAPFVQPSPGPEVSRVTVAERLVAENPYDDVLTWLSERENGMASISELADTWSWLCRRYGLTDLAFRWRGALKVLEDLGHIERHYDSARVGVAPSTFVALPASAGLYALAGARPQQLLERLNNPDDPDAVVAEAALYWQVHHRTPVDVQGRPSGPQAIYLESDPAQRDVVQRGLQGLGVKMRGLVADALLALQPAITDLDAVGTRQTMSPGTEIHRRTNLNGVYDWKPVRDDARPGLYSYRLRSGRAFAWRQSPGDSLVEVEFGVGEWLLRAAEGETSLLHADQGTRRRLAVPEAVQLPRMISRALVLRSGLPPRVSRIGPGPALYLVYENVDSSTTRNVAQLLAQEPVAGTIMTARQG